MYVSTKTAKDLRPGDLIAVSYPTGAIHVERVTAKERLTDDVRGITTDGSGLGSRTIPMHVDAVVLVVSA